MKVRYAAAGVALSLVGLGLTGCGDSAPKSEAKPEKIDVQQSAAWLQSAEAVKSTISLSGDVAALKKLSESNGEKVTKEEEAALELLTSAKIVVVGSAKAQNDPKALGSVAVQLGGQDLLSAVVSQDDAYLKVDPAQLPASLNEQLKKSGGGDVTQIAGLIDMFAPGAGDVLRNKWVHVDLASVYKLTGQPRPTQNAATQAKAQKVLEDLLAKVTVADSADAGHKVATVKGADLKVALDELVNLGTGLTGQGSSPDQLKDMKAELDKADLPAESKVDLYFDGDKLIKVGVDLTQYDKKNTTGGEPLNLEVAFEEAQPVTAPADAKDVDLSKALENFKSMMGGSLNG